MECRAVDGVVHADVDIVCILIHRKVRAVRNIGEGPVLAGGNGIRRTEHLGLFPGLLCPLAGDDVITYPVLHQVHRHHGKLHVTAALDEKYFIIIRNIHEIPKVLFRLIDDILEIFRSMAHLHNGLTAVLVLQHLCCSFP